MDGPSKPAVDAFLATRHPGDHDQLFACPSLIDDAPGTALDADADADAPEVAASQLHGTGWSTFVSECRDHTAECQKVDSVQAIDVQLTRWRQDDPPGGHAGQSVSYSTRPSATRRWKWRSASTPPASSYSVSASTDALRSSASYGSWSQSSRASWTMSRIWRPLWTARTRTA